MKKRILALALSLLFVFTCAGCSVFNDMADLLLGEVATPEPIVLSEAFDPVKAQQEAEAAEKAAREHLSAAEAADKLAASIVTIRAYDASGTVLTTGTGFFAYGGVFTTMDAIRGAERADIVLYDGGVYEVTGVRGYSEALNIACLACTRRDPPDLAGGKWGVEEGESVYALAADGAANEGSVIAAQVSLNGSDYMQASAAIDSENAGGPLVNAYGELLGLCVSNAAGDGQNYAVSAAALEALDRSETLSLADFRAATAPEPESTRVITGSEGEAVYSSADFIELEPNDTTVSATALQAGQWTAAYINRPAPTPVPDEDETEETSEAENETDESAADKPAQDADGAADAVDIFSFTVEQTCTIEILLRPYADDDLPYLDGTWVINENLDHLADPDGEPTGYIAAGEIDGVGFQCGEAQVQPGTYYIVVRLTDGWPHASGCYYTICYNVK